MKHDTEKKSKDIRTTQGEYKKRDFAINMADVDNVNNVNAYVISYVLLFTLLSIFVQISISSTLLS